MAWSSLTRETEVEIELLVLSVLLREDDGVLELVAHGGAGHGVELLRNNFSRPKLHTENLVTDDARGIEVSAMIFCIFDGTSANRLRSAGRSALTGYACRELYKATDGPSPSDVAGANLAERSGKPCR